jgi:hypothetical protein
MCNKKTKEKALKKTHKCALQMKKVKVQNRTQSSTNGELLVSRMRMRIRKLS